MSLEKQGVVIIMWIIYCLYAFHCMQRVYPRRVSTPIYYAAILLVYPATLFFEFQFDYPVQILISFVVVYILIFALLKTPLWGRLFFTAEYVLIYVFTQCVISSLNAIVTGASFYSIFYRDVASKPIPFFSSPIISIFMYAFVNHLLRKFNIFRMAHYKKLREILTTLLLIYGVILLCSTAIYQVDDNDIFIPIYHLTIALLLFSTYIWIFLYQYNNISYMESARDNNRLLHLIDTQKVHYKKNVDYIRSLRKVKHDYHWLLYELTENSENLNHEQLLARLQEQYDSIDANYHQYSNNLLIDSIISETSEVCEQHGITFDCSLNIPKDIDFSEDELCFNVATFLNMSIDKIMSSNTAEKVLRIHDQNSEYWYVMNFELSADDTELSDNPNVQPDFVLANEIMEAHGGYLQFDYDKDKQILRATGVTPKVLKNPTIQVS
ncbi:MULTISPECIES: hypothetical protein [unclassified Breznakia]|uniref:hypothetical protein n=1 Tax=unclassified Breznakia TaxID=2623764 RepID=UPI002474FEC6|nr:MULTISPECIES: hypothetical protein [unclassified Breznakia]MDH6366586.1 hypothetical protein [Breznakia sp. PH1-1]MDH6403679.1 hypothetical protein [Breznakia sp. PF1-11]MDH6411388.1 hypothetical protein [Breznakia sp. PFB1-11]MDH6413636.1 hypothetical protein [Breznakia sp. PFB1-14]MDH6415933.1 hypothetical protein [Breznakia sp. PFB1-4]